MLGKHYSLGSVFEPTGEQLVKIANFDELVEQGENIASFLKTFKPDSDNFMYLHVIAMSAGEYYGCNINKDYFPEQDLINRHKTFETNAKVFKEHDNKPTSQDYGHVEFAWYNTKMHRVELILAIDRIKGKWIVDKQNAGEQLCVSMGTKVKFDICSICGNHASKPNEYCEHIRFHKGEVFPNGKQAYMINPNPTFFDISIVARPADKTAFVLSKVASDNTKEQTYTVMEKAASEFENLGVEAKVEQPAVTWEIPDDDIFFGEENYKHAVKVASAGQEIDRILGERKKHASISKQADIIKRVPADAVREINKEVFNFLPAIEKIEKDLPTPLLDNLARNYSISDILKSFVGGAIPLKPHEFVRIVITKNNIPEEFSDDILEGVNCALFNNDNPYIPKGTFRGSIIDLLEPFLKNRSSFLEAILPRLHTILDEGSYGGLVKKAAELYRPNPVMEALDQNPQMNFGYIRRKPSFQQMPVGLQDGVILINKSPEFSTLPTAYSREALIEELQRPKLSNWQRDQALALGMDVGQEYANFKNPEVIRSVLNEPTILSSLGLLLDSFKPAVDKPLAATKDVYNKVVVDHLLNAHNPNKRSFIQNLLSI